MNKIIVIGNLGRDPEMRYTPSGQPVTSFSIASSRRYTTANGERREETEWFNVTAFGKLGEICNQYLSKGHQVYVEGRLKSRTFQGRDGQTRFVNEITLTDMHLLRQAGAGGRGEAPYDGEGGEPEPGMGGDAVDDLPF